MIASNSTFSTYNIMNLVLGGFNQEFIDSGLVAFNYRASGCYLGIYTTDVTKLPRLSYDSMTSDCSLEVTDTSKTGLIVNYTSVTVGANTEWGMEFWFKTNLATIPADRYLVCYGGITAGTHVYLAITSSRLLKVAFRAGSATETVRTTSYTIADGVWNHYSISRDTSNVVRVFVNGTQVDSFTAASGALTNTAIYLCSSDTLTTSLPGNVCGVRIRSGSSSAIRTSSFTPPTDIPSLYSGSASITITAAGGSDPNQPLYQVKAMDSYSTTVRGYGFCLDPDTSFSVPHVSGLPNILLAQINRGAAWLPGTNVAEGDTVIPSTADKASPGFYCTTAGTTGSSEPIWVTTSTVSDGTAVWTYSGRVHLGYTYTVMDT
jgi:hypothetical protein